MKKIFYTFLLLLCSILSFGQTETHVFRTYDTIINAGFSGITWRLRISRPTGMFGSGADTASRPVLFTVPGQGEMGTDTNKLVLWGPHYWLNNGWDGSVTLANGVHYPILITAISSNTFFSGKEFAELLNTVLSIYHIKRNAVHIGGLSQGAFCTSASIFYERVGGDEFGMKQVTSLVGLEGRDEWPNGYPSTVNKFVGRAWGHWAKKYGGKYFGLEGTADNARNLWEVQTSCNDSMPGSAYYGYETFGGGAHCCWNSMWDPGKGTWRSIAPYDPNLTSNIKPTSLGTWKQGDNIFTWMMRQGDTTLVGGDVTTANAGSDVNVDLAFQPSTVDITGTYHVAAGETFTSQTWTRISGPNTPTLTNASTATVTIGGATPLIVGSYVYRYTIVTSGGTTTDDVTINVISTSTNFNPTGSATPSTQTIIGTSTASITSSWTPVSPATIASYDWSKLMGPSQAAISVLVDGGSTAAGQNVGSSSDSAFVKKLEAFYVNLGLITSITNVAYSGKTLDNVDYPALRAQNKDVYLFAYLSNGYTASTNTATLLKLRNLRDSVIAWGKQPFFIGPSPRDDFSPADRTNLKVINDSMKIQMGARFIEIYPVLADPVTNMMKSIYAAGDAIHPGIAGHDQIFRIVAAKNILRNNTTNTATISAATSANTSFTSLQNETSKFQIGVTDSKGYTAFSIVSVTKDPSGHTTYIWDTSQANIVINRTNYPNIRAGDSVIINARNGKYNSTVFANLNCGITNPNLDSPNQLIVIRLMPGAWMQAATSDNQFSYMDSCYGVKIYGLKAAQRNAQVARLGKSSGVGSSYSKYIVWDSCQLIGSSGFELSMYGGFAYHNGDKDNRFHHWRWINLKVDSSYGQGSNYTQWAINLGTPFGSDSTRSFGDVEILNSTFDHYYAGDNRLGQLGGGGYVYNNRTTGLKIAGCRFDNLSMNMCPSGHNSVIGGSISQAEIYNCTFAYNHANEFRGTTFDVPSWGYIGGLKFYNNLVTNKWKYPFVEFGDASLVGSSLSVIGRVRKTVEVYNITLHGPAIGARQSMCLPYNNVHYDRVGVDITGVNDTAIVHNVIIDGAPRDSLTYTSFMKPVASNGAYVADTGSNLIIVTYANVGYADSVNYTPSSSSALVDKGPSSLPSYVVNNYPAAKGSRISNGFSDIGWAEYQNGSNLTPLVNAGTDQSIQAPLSVISLTGTATDPDGSISSKSWTQVSGPNTATLANATTFTLGVSNMIEGTYVFRFSATDNGGATATDDVTVTVTPANQPPISIPGSDQILARGVDSAFVSGTGNDFDGTVTGYLWVQISGPNTAVIANPGSASTKISGMLPGVHVFQLTVTDNQGANGANTLSITARPAITKNNSALRKITTN